MGNVDWMERLKAIFKNRDMVKVVSLIVAAIVVVVSVFAIVPRFFSSEKEEVVVNKTEMEALNADAETLLETFKWENKKLENCFTDLLDKAHEDGFLRNNAMVKIVAQQNWNTDEKI